MRDSSNPCARAACGGECLSVCSYCDDVLHKKKKRLHLARASVRATSFIGVIISRNRRNVDPRFRHFLLCTNTHNQVHILVNFSRTNFRIFLKPVYLNSAKIGESNDVLHKTHKSSLIKTANFSSSFFPWRNRLFQKNFSLKFTSSPQESIPIERT